MQDIDDLGIYGVHEDVPLPPNTMVEVWLSDALFQISIGGNVCVEYSMNPPPSSDEVYADLFTSQWMADDDHCERDIQQIIDHLGQRGLVI